MTIRHLRIFIEVADSGKMSIAASKFFISQPTVSQAIRELEEHYGVLLFERLSKRLFITESGVKLLSYARHVVRQFDDLEEKMYKSSHVEKIKIGATITIGNCLLTDIISDFKARNQGVETYAYVNNTSVIEEKLLKSELDIGIVEGEVKSLDLVCIPAVDDYLVLACSTTHPLANKDKVKLKELVNADFVMREQGSGTRELFENYMSQYGFPVKTVWESNCPGAIKKAVIDSGCLAVISIRLIEDEIKNGDIHVIENSESTWNRSFSIVYHKDKILNPSMKSFIEMIKNYKHANIQHGTNYSQLVRE